MAKFTKGASSSTPNPKPTWNTKLAETKKPQFPPTNFKSETPQSSKPVAPFQGKQGKFSNPPTPIKDIVCFKCQGRGHYARDCINKRTVIINHMGGYEIESEDEQEEEEEETIQEDILDEETAQGEIFVYRMILNMQPKDEEEDPTPQRENIFHSRCLVQGKLCSIIIDGGSCTNVASIYLVEKLGLPTITHSRPYKLQWLNDQGEVKVTKQVLIPFSLVITMMRFCVMLFQCKHVTFFWGGRGNLTRMLTIEDPPTSIHSCIRAGNIL